MTGLRDSGRSPRTTPLALYHCEHAYPSGEYCPACGDVPGAYDGGMLHEEHEVDCECFACTEEPDGASNEALSTRGATT